MTTPERPTASGQLLVAAPLLDGFSCYLRLVGANVRAQMQYRLGFLFDIGANFFGLLFEFAAIAVLFLHVPALGSWRLPEIALLYGTVELALATARLVAAGFDSLPEMVRLGDFDRVLTRPRSASMQVLASEFTLRQVGRAAQGALVLAAGVVWLQPSWAWWEWLFLGWTCLGGVLFFFGLFVIGGTWSFWTIESLEVVNVFTYGGSAMASYPMSIYARRMREFFTFVVPLAFVNYYPMLLLLHKPDPFGAPAWVAFLAFPACAAVTAVAGAFWRVGVGHYQSTGH